MPDESFQDKTEAPSPRRRQEARRKGHVAKSVDLNSALLLLMGTAALYFWGQSMVLRIMGISRAVFSALATIELTPANIQSYTAAGVKSVFLILAPILFCLLFTGLLANITQVGVIFTGEPLVPRLSKIDPIAGAKRLLSKRSLVRFIESILKLIIIATVAYFCIRNEIVNCMLLMDGDLVQIGSMMSAVGCRIVVKAGLALLALAVLDYGYQRWEHERGLKMTRQEVRDEHKQEEGDPQVRSRIRSIQRAMARRRMMQDVPTADVVITNPVALAVALKYDVAIMSAPRVVAKGQRLIAQKIKEIAVAHNVPVVEDRPLARVLYDSTEVGAEIPYNLFRAVAEVLAYIYRLKGKTVI